MLWLLSEHYWADTLSVAQIIACSKYSKEQKYECVNLWVWRDRVEKKVSDDNTALLQHGTAAFRPE